MLADQKLCDDCRSIDAVVDGSDQAHGLLIWCIDFHMRTAVQCPASLLMLCRRTEVKGLLVCWTDRYFLTDQAV